MSLILKNVCCLGSSSRSVIDFCVENVRPYNNHLRSNVLVIFYQRKKKSHVRRGELLEPIKITKLLWSKGILVYKILADLG